MALGEGFGEEVGDIEGGRLGGGTLGKRGDKARTRRDIRGDTGATSLTGGGIAVVVAAAVLVAAVLVASEGASAVGSASDEPEAALTKMPGGSK